MATVLAAQRKTNTILAYINIIAVPAACLAVLITLLLVAGFRQADARTTGARLPVVRSDSACERVSDIAQLADGRRVVCTSQYGWHLPKGGNG